MANQDHQMSSLINIINPFHSLGFPKFRVALVSDTLTEPLTEPLTLSSSHHLIRGRAKRMRVDGRRVAPVTLTSPMLNVNVEQRR